MNLCRWACVNRSNFLLLPNFLRPIIALESARLLHFNSFVVKTLSSCYIWLKQSKFQLFCVSRVYTHSQIKMSLKCAMLQCFTSDNYLQKNSWFYTSLQKLVFPFFNEHITTKICMCIMPYKCKIIIPYYRFHEKNITDFP